MMFRGNSRCSSSTSSVCAIVVCLACGSGQHDANNASGTGGSWSTGGTSSSSGGASATGGTSANVGNTTEGYLPGDVMDDWEGGPTYYGRWSNGPSTDPAFFPTAVWLQAPDSTATARKYHEIGINLHIGLWDGPTEVQLAAVAALPSVAIASQTATGLSSPNAGIIRAWLQDDEPDNAQDNTEDPLAPETVVATYKSLMAADSTRPVYLNLGQGVATDTWYGRGNRTNHPEDYVTYAQGGDILSFDVYPMNVFEVADTEQDWKKAFNNSVAQNIWYVATGVDRLRNWSNKKKPVWTWIETTNMNGETGFALTPDIVNAEVWMAIVHGARGIGYFCHVFSPSFIEAGLLADATMTERVSAINSRIKSLAPVLNTQSVANGVTTASSNSAVPIDTMLKRYNGNTYLFAVGMRPLSTSATFTLRGFTDSRTVEVIGENRSLDAANGLFKDDFTAYAVHIYRIAQ